MTTPTANLGILAGMIDRPPLPHFGDELGLYFARDGDRCRCVEWPGLTMRGNSYAADGPKFDSLAEVRAFRTGASPGGPRNRCT